MIAIRDNPCMEPFPLCRLRLLSLIKRLTDGNDCFSVLDSEITPQERLQVLVASGAPQVRIHCLA
jgi:hypothetical protein